MTSTASIQITQAAKRNGWHFGSEETHNGQPTRQTFVKREKTVTVWYSSTGTATTANYVVPDSRGAQTVQKFNRKGLRDGVAAYLAHN